ncbi:class I SAM-dependent methyltransferase [Clostridium sp. KNHs205]|uniref:class I SAM-dependent methyltransferase n=1 Tax=Clostridium sp. KNHs205 TaxID=1449050 RepID=UPI00051C9D16|nr:class I SAM-dependent methyltransferase [Clostridium sp. KNHs205]
MGNTDIFDMMATGYDTPERIRIAKIISNAVRENLDDADNKKAIDFGCGTGLVGLNLLKDFKSVLFLDSSPNMIEQINQKIKKFNITNADTLCFDLEKESITNTRADYIILAQVLLHIMDIEPVLAGLYDMLNDEGHIIIADFVKNDAVVSDIVHNGFVQEELIELMTRIGFKDIKFKPFYTGSKIFMNQDATLFILDSQKKECPDV